MAKDENGNVEQQLLTEKSLALSLAPPRAPPFGTVQRSILLGTLTRRKPSKQLIWSTVVDALGNPISSHQTDRLQKLMETVYRKELEYNQKHPRRRKHPHLPSAPSREHQITRQLGSFLSTKFKNSIRDSGSFRWIADSLVTVSAPVLAVSAPYSVLADFVALSRFHLERYQYGSHSMQCIELYTPPEAEKCRDLVFFVHGGAWGSGLPWFYRLVAAPFVRHLQDTAVAIVGYRTYPCSQTVDEQVDDCFRAARFLHQKHPELFHRDGDLTVMGHSSGAHLAMLMMVELAKRKLSEASGIRVTNRTKDTVEHFFKVTNLVSLSCPADISHHFDYEAMRGVEELSPMKAVCGYTREAFGKNTPHRRLQDFMAQHNIDESKVGDCMPPNIALVHGIEDDTVPFTATAEAARVLRSCGVTSCDEIYVAKTGHQDVIMHMMMDGPSCDAVLQWMNKRARGKETQFAPSASLMARSSL